MITVLAFASSALALGWLLGWLITEKDARRRMEQRLHQLELSRELLETRCKYVQMRMDSAEKSLAEFTRPAPEPSGGLLVSMRTRLTGGPHRRRVAKLREGVQR